MLFRHNFWTASTGDLGYIIAAFVWFAEVPLRLLKMTSQTASFMFWSDLVTSFAYYIIAIQLLRFANNSKVLAALNIVEELGGKKERKTFTNIVGLGIVNLFPFSVWLCGNTHVISAALLIYPDNSALMTSGEVSRVTCAVVAFLAAMLCFPVFPAFVDVFASFELALTDKVQRADSYLMETLNLMNEGILMISDKLVVLRASDVTQNIFSQAVIGRSFSSLLHPDDRVLFNDAVAQVAVNYLFAPVTVEVRIVAAPLPFPQHTSRPTPDSSQSIHQHTTRRIHDNRIYVDDSLASESVDTTMPNYQPRRRSSHRIAPPSNEKFKWIEITMCRGKQHLESEGFGYDIKMVCRDIDEKKKRQARQQIADGSEEKSRADDIKLRYISSIAHDLKTPVQSFSYSLDLLNQTEMNQEQREYVQQAIVAVDLMRLTISQTMDVSKVLAGAKLAPRRTTVYLSSVLNRVKIIINGYGKQVPITFEVAPEVCDEIITDEEWLWQMILNLLTNACKYTSRGNIQVRISILKEKAAFAGESDTQKYAGVTPLQIDDTTPDMLLCEVIDTGAGIDPFKLRLIFDAFAPVQEGQVTGTGLGLFGVRARAEGLLGTCGARHNTESSTGTGTVLWFTIPYIPDCTVPTYNSRRTASFKNDVDRVCLLSPSLSFSTLNRSGKSATVNDEIAVFTEDLIRRLRLTAMVVEDTLTVRKLMQKLLLKMGFERVDCYENGSTGLEAMVAGAVDIVFSDVQMPIMTGPEMVTRFRKWEADTLRAVVQGNFIAAHAAAAATSGGIATSGAHSQPRSAPQSPHACVVDSTDTHPFSSFPMHRGAQSVLENSSSVKELSLSAPTGKPLHTTRNTHPVVHSPPRLQHTGSRHVRTVRPRQLIVAVTANGAECGECGDNGFDEICLKPLSKSEIYQIINRYFE